MEEYKLIGMIGRKRSGKDTFGEYIVNKHGYNNVSLAKPLKEACKIIFNLSDEQLDTDKEIPDSRWGNITPRKILQLVGTELFRDELNKQSKELNSIGETIWITNFKQWYSKNKDSNVVITDIRFEDEAKMVRDLGGTLINITRNTELQDKHISENEIDNIKAHYYIENNGTLKEFYDKIDELYDSL
jgi:dephospho-CoA kinase